MWYLTDLNITSKINSKSDCIYHFPINLEHKRTCPFVFQINRKMVYTIWFRVVLTRFRKKIRCVVSRGPSTLRFFRQCVGEHGRPKISRLCDVWLCWKLATGKLLVIPSHLSSFNLIGRRNLRYLMFVKPRSTSCGRTLKRKISLSISSTHREIFSNSH